MNWKERYNFPTRLEKGMKFQLRTDIDIDSDPEWQLGKIEEMEYLREIYTINYEDTNRDIYIEGKDWIMTSVRGDDWGVDLEFLNKYFNYIPQEEQKSL